MTADGAGAGSGNALAVPWLGLVFRREAAAEEEIRNWESSRVEDCRGGVPTVDCLARSSMAAGEGASGTAAAARSGEGDAGSTGPAAEGEDADTALGTVEAVLTAT
ncbi:MAG: hypothetical protein ABI051_01700 [Vicinamibacterales bacterium]